MNNKIESLANEMGVSKSDLQAFVACLGVWTAKGYTVEEAIAKHMAQMHRFVAHAIKLSEDTDIRDEIVNTLYAA